MATSRFESHRTQNRRKDECFSHIRLAEVECFKGLSVDFKEALIQELDIELFSKGDFVMKEGTDGSNMIFLLHGSVDVKSKEEKVATLCGGALFGEMVCLGLSKRRTCSVVANEFCDCRCISAWHFRTLLTRFPDAKLHFERIAGERRSVLREMQRTTEVEALLDRSRCRAAKNHIELELVSRRRLDLLMALHEKTYMLAFGAKTKRIPTTVDETSRASFLAAGWTLDQSQDDDDEPEPYICAPSQYCSAINVDQENERDDEADLESLRMGLQDSPLASHCRRPLAPAHASPGKPGSTFRQGRLFKQQGVECSLESADTTAPSSRSASIDLRNCPGGEWLLPTVSEPSRGRLVNPSGADEAPQAFKAAMPARNLPTMPEHTRGRPVNPSGTDEAPQTLKASMQAKNAFLRERLVKAREELSHGCPAPKVRWD